MRRCRLSTAGRHSPVLRRHVQRVIRPRPLQACARTGQRRAAYSARTYLHARGHTQEGTIRHAHTYTRSWAGEHCARADGESVVGLPAHDEVCRATYIGATCNSATCHSATVHHAIYNRYADSLYRAKQLKRAALGRMCTIAKKLGPSLAYLEQVHPVAKNVHLRSMTRTTKCDYLCGWLVAIIRIPCCDFQYPVLVIMIISTPYE
jgi:hypothetical protein